MVAPAKSSAVEANATRRSPGARLRLAPSLRFLVVAGISLLVPALLELRIPTAKWGFYAALLVVSVACALDALAGSGRARGLTASMVRLSRLVLGRRGEVGVCIQSTVAHPMGIRVGLELPEDLGVDPVEPEISLPPGGSVHVGWQALPRSRGAFRPEKVHVETSSPLGLWTVRWVVPFEGEIRVYPDLRAEGRPVAALFLRRSNPGARAQRLVGRGREFEKLREYLPGDGYDEIHWKATAKRGHPVTKVFQAERTQEVYAIIESSRLSGRAGGPSSAGPGARSLLERQITAALALALAAERQGDLYGLMTYADVPRTFVRAANGAAHFQACREALVSLRSEPVSPDMREVCTFLRARLRKRALIVFLASMDDPALAEEFVEASTIIARQHVVVVASPLPSDARPLFSGSPPESSDEALSRLGGHIRWQGLQDLGARLRREGVHLALLERDALAAGAISQYMEIKQRQLI